MGIVLLFVLYYGALDSRGILSFFQRLELQAYDARLLSTMPEKIDPRVLKNQSWFFHIEQDTFSYFTDCGLLKVIESDTEF